MSSQFKKLNRKPAGFTIIEVMIVLAIAALILLIVFLAVPALQRNSRNTQYRSEAARIMGGANEFTTNNNNTLPAASSCATGNCSNAATNDAMRVWQNANNPGNITALNVVAYAAGTVPNAVSTSNAYLYTASRCPANPITGGTTALVSGPAKSMILFYGIEGSGGATVIQCVTS
jgi:prepilin-type N-terminal cleavage/methylation domain-containing protein